MVSDDECREVARRLRRLSDDLRAGRRNRIRLDDIRRVVFGHECPSLITDRLADLMEPSCDRDALLALADELEDVSLEGDNNGDELVLSRGAAFHYSRCIREALGVSE